MKVNLKVAAILFSIFFTSSAGAVLQSEHYIFDYGKDMIFDVKLTDHDVTWESLTGSDKGQKETDKIDRKSLSTDVEVIQWTENDGTFVTVVFDRVHLTIISSGKYSSGTWLRSGAAYIAM